MSGICPLSCQTAREPGSQGVGEGEANLEDEFIEFFSLGIRQTRKFSTKRKRNEKEAKSQTKQVLLHPPKTKILPDETWPAHTYVYVCMMVFFFGVCILAKWNAAVICPENQDSSWDSNLGFWAFGQSVFCSGFSSQLQMHKNHRSISL